MDEHFLQYVWKFQKFQSKDLFSTSGEPLTVFFPGYMNRDAGPDFRESRIKIGDIEWAGNIEVHKKSSDWLAHKHQKNLAYKNVILHVVWEHDKEIKSEHTFLPTLELKKIVDIELLSKYKNYTNSTPNTISCANHIKQIDALTIYTMLDKMMAERLETKSERINKMLKKTTNNWEEVIYHTLAYNFGFGINKEVFHHLSEKMPYSVLSKYITQEKQLEALLFGQAGFLNDVKDSYQKELANEYQYLKNKHQLDKGLEIWQWKFAKLRPANFPSVRIAQFASFIHKNMPLFPKIIDSENVQKEMNQLNFIMSEYWMTHYNFGKKRKRKSKEMGKSSIQNIYINTIAPILVAYARFSDEQIYMDHSNQLLQGIPSETNWIITLWKDLGVFSKHAFDSQSLIQLYNNYCSKRRCLNCDIGVKIIKN